MSIISTIRYNSISSLEELNKFKRNSHIVQDVSLPHIQCGEGQSTLGLAGIREVIELQAGLSPWIIP